MEFRQSLWIEYVDLSSAFDSVDREMMWSLLPSQGLPQKILDLTRLLFSDTLSVVTSD